MDPILASLAASLLAFVEDQLSNNEVPSDEVLVEHFVDNGLTEAQARHALAYREQYLSRIYLEGFTPIQTGREALHFDPHSRQFVPD